MLLPLFFRAGAYASLNTRKRASPVLFLEIAGVLSALAGVGLWLLLSPPNLGALILVVMLVVSAVFLAGRVIAGEIRHLRDDLTKANDERWIAGEIRHLRDDLTKANDER
jgi:hypothetical protein